MNKLDQWKSTTKEVRRSMIAHSLAKAIRKIELPFDISVRAYQVKIESLINTDDFENPKRVRFSGDKTHTNGIINREEMWSEFEYLFHLLNNGDFNDIAMQTIKIFYRLDNEVNDQLHYDRVKECVAKLLDLYGHIEIISELPKRNL